MKTFTELVMKGGRGNVAFWAPVAAEIMCRVLLVPGSLRAASTNLAVLRTALTIWPHAVLFEGLGSLPLFNPDLDTPPTPPTAAELRDQIHQSSAILFCTPEYAGALPGAFKNLLDWTIGDDHPRSLYEKPVGWLNARPHGAIEAHAELRRVLGYAHARIVEEACLEVPVTSSLVGDDGLIADGPTRELIRAALVALCSSSAELDGRSRPPPAELPPVL